MLLIIFERWWERERENENYKLNVCFLIAKYTSCQYSSLFYWFFLMFFVANSEIYWSSNVYLLYTFILIKRYRSIHIDWYLFIYVHVRIYQCGNIIRMRNVFLSGIRNINKSNKIIEMHRIVIRIVWKKMRRMGYFQFSGSMMQVFLSIHFNTHLRFFYFNNDL